MDGKLLLGAHREIETRLPGVYSLLVVRHGWIVVERSYRSRYDRESLFDVRSVTKSVTGALVGVALQEGYLKSSDQRLLGFFPEEVEPGHDARLDRIKLEHLLAMTSGFEWDTATQEFLFFHQEDRVAWTLKLPMADEPGQVFRYFSPGSHLLSVILENATGREMASFADEQLFRPLGIENWEWTADQQGHTEGWVGLRLSTHDLAKFGYLYLHEGRWKGRQIVPAEWVRRSTRQQSEGGDPESAAYGYHWWVAPDAPSPMYYAAGYGGQYVVVVPGLDLIVVITSNPTDAYNEPMSIIPNSIVPAVRE